MKRLVVHNSETRRNRSTALLGLLMASLLWLPMHAAPAMADVTLRLMTWVGYSPDPQVAEFEQRMSKKYGEPVHLKIHYINGYDEGFTLLRRGEADVVVLVDHILHDARFQFIANKLIVPLNLEMLPNYQYVLETYKPYVEHEGRVYAVPIASGPYGQPFQGGPNHGVFFLRVALR